MLILVRWIYSILFPVVFLFFVPGLLFKLWRRPGWKSTFSERFGLFGKRRAELTAYRGAVWVHAVSVGETVLALALLNAWRKQNPELRFVLSTTTTTGQALAREKTPEGVAVIFSPLDFGWVVRRTLRLLQPRLLVIFETEIWPNLILATRDRKIPVALVNARMSDRSVKGYYRFRCFFGPLLAQFQFIGAQSTGDAERFLRVSPAAPVVAVGNLKFDQALPAQLPQIDYSGYFGKDFSAILLAASTHPGEEELIAATYRKLQPDFPGLRLVLVPRHAERGAEVAAAVQRLELSNVQRSRYRDGSPEPVVCLVADTTGEMLALMQAADVVIMGKSLAGQDEGHNLLEPALLHKPVITGKVLKNFRFILKILEEAGGVVTVTDATLESALRQAFAAPSAMREVGERAFAAMEPHRGATGKLLTQLEKLL